MVSGIGVFSPSSKLKAQSLRYLLYTKEMDKKSGRMKFLGNIFEKTVKVVSEPVKFRIKMIKPLFKREKCGIIFLKPK
jgi:muramoyltetrapeptide carboxypeptidase LdcA involved in peptidoglycan recycling